MARKDKVVVKAIKVESETETHMQMFARLANPIFNTGAMHGTPGVRKGKSK